MLIGLILLILISYYLTHKIIHAICMAVPIWTLFLYVVTEILSIGSLATQTSLRIVWGSADIAFLFCVLILILKDHRNRKVSAESTNECKISQTKKIIIGNKAEIILAILFVAFSVVMLWLASNIVPYNWDSMTYHLTRILMWAQNRSIGHFAATVKRTVSSPVLGEVVNLHTYLMHGGNDSLFNLLQCFSYLLNILLVYGIARKLKANNIMAGFAAFLFLSTPIAFAESLTTQVDEFSTLWLLIFVFLILDLIKDGEKLQLNSRGIWYLLLLAISAGLGYLAKPSVMIGMFGFTLWLLVVCIQRKETSKTIMIWVVLTSAFALVIILPEIARNICTYGSISDPWQGKGQMVQTIDPRYVFVGFLKNLFFNLPSSYWPNINSFLEKVVYYIAMLLHINADDILISESGRAFSLTVPPDYGCDSAISPVPFVVMILCIVVFLIKCLIKKESIGKVSYTKVSFVLFLVMCAVIRWEPWIGRYQLSYFALICPAIALQLWKLRDKQKWVMISGFLCGIVFMMSSLELQNLFSSNIELLNTMENEPREEAYYYYNSSSYENSYLPLIEAFNIDSPSTVGLYTDEDSYVYPLMKYLIDNGCEVGFITGAGDTIKYDDSSYQPEYIIYLDSALNTIEPIECHGAEYSVYSKIGDTCYILMKNS